MPQNKGMQLTVGATVTRSAPPAADARCSADHEVDVRRTEVALVGIVTFVMTMGAACLIVGALSAGDAATALASPLGLMVAPWSVVAMWAAARRSGSLERRAGSIATIVSFVGLGILLHNLDQPGSGLDVAALVAVPGWPLALVAGMRLRDVGVSAGVADAFWCLGTGASPMLWCAILVWVGRRSAFVRSRALRLGAET